MKHSRSFIVLISLLAAACSSSSGDDAPDSGASPVALSAQVASYELVAGTPDRFLIGLFTDDGVVSYGTADLSFSYLGDGQASPEPGPTASATFLLVPQEGAGHTHDADPSATASPMEGMDGMGEGDGHEVPALPTDEELTAAEDGSPAVTQPDQTRGVYQAKEVEFDDAGIWQAEVSIDIDGAAATTTTAFQVVEEPAYPAIGQDALATDNLVMDSKDAKPSMVDSRGNDGWGSIPDPELHSTTIAEALDAGHAAVVVVSTPLYCQSRFCGPITDQVQALAHEYEGVADFVHLEVWRNYQDKVVNKAAAEWVYRDDITEPWVFLIGTDGKIIDRWANVMDVRDLSAELENMGAAQGAVP